MPTFAVAPSIFTHSWSLVYFRSAGYMRFSNSPGLGAGLLLPLVERRRDDSRFRAPAADVDLEIGAWRRAIRRHVGHADRLLQKRGLRAARHHAGLVAADVDVVAVT